MSIHENIAPELQRFIDDAALGAKVRALLPTPTILDDQKAAMLRTSVAELEGQIVALKGALAHADKAMMHAWGACYDANENPAWVDGATASEYIRFRVEEMRTQVASLTAERNVLAADLREVSWVLMRSSGIACVAQESGRADAACAIARKYSERPKPEPVVPAPKFKKGDTVRTNDGRLATIHDSNEDCSFFTLAYEDGRIGTSFAWADSELTIATGRKA